MKEYLKFMWADTKVMWWIMLAFFLIFHIGGMFANQESFVQAFIDMVPMYLIMLAIALTLVTYEYKKYKTFKDNKEQDEAEFNQIDLNAH